MKSPAAFHKGLLAEHVFSREAGFGSLLACTISRQSSSDFDESVQTGTDSFSYKSESKNASSQSGKTGREGRMVGLGYIFSRYMVLAFFINGIGMC
jgi:hypothetical protein